MLQARTFDPGAFGMPWRLKNVLFMPFGLVYIYLGNEYMNIIWSNYSRFVGVNDCVGGCDGGFMDLS